MLAWGRQTDSGQRINGSIWLLQAGNALIGLSSFCYPENRDNRLHLEQLLWPQWWSQHIFRIRLGVCTGSVQEGAVTMLGSGLELPHCVAGGGCSLKTSKDPFGTRFRKSICCCCSSDLLLEPSLNWKETTRNKIKPNQLRICLQTTSNLQVQVKCRDFFFFNAWVYSIRTI